MENILLNYAILIMELQWTGKKDTILLPEYQKSEFKTERCRESNILKEELDFS